MIEDKYEETVWDLTALYTHTEMAEEVLLLVADIKRLREALVGDSKDWTTDELVEKALTLYDKALAWDKIVEYHSKYTETEDDTQHDWEMRELMSRILKEVKQ